MLSAHLGAQHAHASSLDMPTLTHASTHTQVCKHTHCHPPTGGPARPPGDTHSPEWLRIPAGPATGEPLLPTSRHEGATPRLTLPAARPCGLFRGPRSCGPLPQPHRSVPEDTRGRPRSWNRRRSGWGAPRSPPHHRGQVLLQNCRPRAHRDPRPNRAEFLGGRGPGTQTGFRSCSATFHRWHLVSLLTFSEPAFPSVKWTRCPVLPPPTPCPPRALLKCYSLFPPGFVSTTRFPLS